MRFAYRFPVERVSGVIIFNPAGESRVKAVDSCQLSVDSFKKPEKGGKEAKAQVKGKPRMDTDKGG